MVESCSLKSSSGRLILLSTILASGAGFLAGSAVPVALPRIQDEFSSALSGIQWVVNANLLALSALILIGGALGDLYGRKRIYISGLAVFTLAALASGFSPSIGILIALQGVQGIGAAMMIPQSLAIINDCFIESERGRAIGLWAGISGALAAVGPLAAGWLVDTLSWHWVFFMMVPVGLAALALSVAFVPGIRPGEKYTLDWPGGLLILIGLFGLAYGLISGPDRGWDSIIVLVSLATGAVAIAVFIYYEIHRRHPLVNLTIFRNPLVTGANVVTLFLYFGLNGVMFYTVIFLQQVLGYSPTRAGLALLPPILFIAILTGPSGILADKIGPRWQMITGPVIVAAGMALLAAAGTGSGYFTIFLPGLALFGIGMAAVIPPLTKSALSVSKEFSGSASGINNVMSRVAGLLAIAVLGVIILSIFSGRLADNLSTTDLSPAQQQEITGQAEKLGGISVPDSFSGVEQQQANEAIDDSFAAGYRSTMAICAGLAFCGGIISVFLIRQDNAGGETSS